MALKAYRCRKCGGQAVILEGASRRCAICRPAYRERRLKDPTFRRRLVRNRKDWGKRNPERIRALHRTNERRLRVEAIQAYGGKCECCGESRPQFLTFDHRNRDGAAHRREVEIRIARWAKRNGYPETLRLLCYNCNCAREFAGFCHGGVPSLATG